LIEKSRVLGELSVINFQLSIIFIGRGGGQTTHYN
jgi:hypothetical protein